jgi:hypothetical protein
MCDNFTRLEVFDPRGNQSYFESNFEGFSVKSKKYWFYMRLKRGESNCYFKVIQKRLEITPVWKFLDQGEIN